MFVVLVTEVFPVIKNRNRRRNEDVVETWNVNFQQRAENKRWTDY